MSGRNMSVKYNQEESITFTSFGGFLQGSTIGQDCFLSASNGAAEQVYEEINLNTKVKVSDHDSKTLPVLKYALSIILA